MVNGTHLNVDSGLDADGGHLLEDVVRGVDHDGALVDAHLEAVPRLRALAARRLAARDAERLRRHAHRALHLQVLVLRRLQDANVNDRQRGHGP